MWLRGVLFALPAQVPIVQLVAQGGPGTVATVLAAACTATPIVILADSGGAATALHDYMTNGIDAVEKRFKSHAESMRMVSQMNQFYGGRLV
eukprot:1328845-Prymnesium_polylepis.2